MTDSVIRAYVENRTGIVELNRPQALNSLNLEMVTIISKHMSIWEADPDIDQILIYSNSKAFCAGGDVRLAREYIIAGDPERADEFFRAEYAMNAQIHHCTKPYIALIDGVAMGGGLGISVHGSHRIISENALAAMPEMAIGFIPDVGVAYMAQRMVGQRGFASPALARFMLLSGWHLGPADLLWSGFATHYVEHADMEGVRSAIIAHGIDQALDRYARPVKGESELARFAEAIEEVFSAAEWPDIERRLTAYPELAERFDTLTKVASPTSMIAALELLTRSQEASTIEEELRLEERLGAYQRQHPDFAEGVRAVLVDKTRDASFSPAHIDNVDKDAIKAALELS
ncbi:3-hydroxyisobutyryl-CoA hydrolase [Corynebacterium sp. ES2775-CONJ]|uniref:3-hydroxyisobutyryl-CoA hydrolase n=1 Tax=Corynebacterium sp. ES2775-CONJ TaxID=2974029 RepID=UPI0021694029|nr:3-hydroxyisobutyryl-CoA hydrolase [Corynebacterium sp. ES2775-CONJ]MCS4489981.1 3-hydroxyisobutyryl-CoA hydrolase [Corynebacterium sp. ES2775-CONJ]